MKYEFAVITTDSETTDIPMPIALSKLQEVAAGKSSLSPYEDEQLAKWALKINEIMMLR